MHKVWLALESVYKRKFHNVVTLDIGLGCHLSLLGSSHRLSDAQTQGPAQWRRNCVSNLE